MPNQVEYVLFSYLFTSYLIHSLISSNLWNLSSYLHHSIDNQSRGHQDTIVGDRLNVLHLDHLSVDTQFLDRLLGSLRELIALRSTHSENFDLFHCLYLLYSNFLISSGERTFPTLFTWPSIASAGVIMTP